MISDNTARILEFLKKNFGKEFSKEEIAETLSVSPRAVTGAISGINGLLSRGFVTERTEEVEVEPATETRKAKMKTIRYETLTEAGLAYDPEAEEAARQTRIAEKKAAEKAAREAAKAAATAE